MKFIAFHGQHYIIIIFDGNSPQPVKHPERFYEVGNFAYSGKTKDRDDKLDDDRKIITVCLRRRGCTRNPMTHTSTHTSNIPVAVCRITSLSELHVYMATPKTEISEAAKTLQIPDSSAASVKQCSGMWF